MSEEAFENLLSEDRAFPPDPAFAARANVTAEAYEDASADRLRFWDQQADRLDWERRWDQTLDWSNAPFAK